VVRARRDDDESRKWLNHVFSLSIFSVADEDLAPIVMPLKNMIQKHKEVPKRKVPNDYNIICT
jgi:hypothetical protein